MSARTITKHPTALLLAAALAAAGALTACGGDVKVTGGTGGSSAGGAGGAAGQGGAAGSAGGVAGSAGTATTSGDGGGITTSDGFCLSAKDCAPGQYCNDYSDACLPEDVQGTCDDATLCSNKGPVCGCDGAIHETDCAAYQAGVDIATSGCAAPAGMFTCGAYLCKSGAQACIHYVGFAMFDACEDYPAACAMAPSCACLQGNCKCETDPDGHFVLTCNTGD